ncbi:hypothetical protein N0824_02517 [Microcystis sp. 0824]|nr:hypothetical protein N0824_02517 [Microcystis sp. 0824]
MTQTGETFTYSLESVLTSIESKIDTFQRDVNQKLALSNKMLMI